MKKAAVLAVSALVLLIVVGTASLTCAAEKKVAVMWEGKTGMAKRVCMGFLHKMKELAPTVETTTRIEIKDMVEAGNVFHEFEKTMDGIVFLRSSGAEFLAKVDPKVPCFVGGANNPLYLGTIKNLDAPEGKVTGVTYFIPYERRFEAIRSLFPNVKSVGLLLQKGHPGTPIDQEGTRAQCNRLGLEYHEVVAGDSKELLAETQKLVGKVQLLIMSSTGLVIDNAIGLVGISNREKTPIFSYAEGRAKLGATAELAADDEKLGAMLAGSVFDVVVRGRPVSQVPVKMDPEPRLIINDASVKSLGMTLPPEVLSRAEVIK